MMLLSILFVGTTLANPVSDVQLEVAAPDAEPRRLELSKSDEAKVKALVKKASQSWAVTIAAARPLSAEEAADLIRPVCQQAADAVDLCTYNYVRKDRWNGGCRATCALGISACRLAVGVAFLTLPALDGAVNAFLLETLVCQNIVRGCASYCGHSIRKKMRLGYEFALCHEDNSEEGMTPAKCKAGRNDWVTVTEVDAYWYNPLILSTHHKIRHHDTKSRTPGREEIVKLGFNYRDVDGAYKRKPGDLWVCRDESGRSRRRIPAGLAMLSEPVEESL